MPNTNKEDELALLRSKVTELESTVLTLRQSLSESELTIQSLVEKLNLARRKRFGSSSETLPPQDLEFNEAETHADTTGEEEAPDNPNDDASEAENTSSETKRRGRPKLPEDLPRERVVVDIPESEKTCSCCQSILSRMGQSTSEKLVYIPAKLYVEVTERPKYVCRQCDALGEKSVVAMAPPPASIIPKSIATPSLLAQIITNKYHCALPLYRQESLFRQYGLALSRKTMSQWILRCADKVEPLIALLKETLLAQDVLFVDETTLTVLDDERKVTSGCMGVVQTVAVMRNLPVSSCSTTRKGVGGTTALNRTCQTKLDTFMWMGIKRMKRQKRSW
ncbi:hypothetical protein VCRA2133E348_250008 [Vibrio crassostreae]|nr:hypothetical protein VCRA2119O48_220008 [Vibrio crassostreae]CAK2803714.1 hypothetical protein VCRA2133E348_250008 [Vibrio crassostreae]CAK3292461.1 hypothetical protein VCRA213O314_240086 [Vibrio crassostreae]CAK3846749.1 hypothetical protein VCRA212O16_230008 [Vibrio crassostreae]